MEKKHNPQDAEMEAMLDRVVSKYQEILLKAANVKSNEDMYGYKERFFGAMQSGANAAKTGIKTAVDKYIQNIDSRISTALQSFGAKYSGEDIKLTTYVRMVDALNLSVEQYRYNIERQIQERTSEGKTTTVGDLQAIINQDLVDGKVDVVKYGSGAQMPVGKYAAMLARTTRAETDNLAMIQQALREGIDLVECDVVSPTCDTCAVYQGRVYSISGNDSRYPALYRTAFKSGYSIIHPNCRHSWSPYRVELYSEEERKEMIKQSNRTFRPDGDGRRFQQTERMREEYAAGQQKMRQWNSEIVEYERMKTFYKERGEEPPYKTLGAFRREVRKPMEKQAPAMKAWKRHKADQQQYDRWKEVVGEKNMPKTLAKFQDLKYNKNGQELYTRLERMYQGYSAYKLDNPDCTANDYRTALKLRENGVQGAIQIPAQIIDTKNYTFRDWHVNDEHERNLTRESAEDSVKNAIISIVQWKGQRVLYYSQDGATVIDKKTKEIITTWASSEFDEHVKKIIKEVLSGGKE